MRTIGIEEHWVTGEVLGAWAAGGGADGPPEELAERLRDTGEARIAAMDEAGLDVQVLSLTSPGLNDLAPAQAASLQVAVNDRIAAIVAERPDRFQGSAPLPWPARAGGAAELQRAVRTLGLNGALIFGRVGARNLDHAENWPVFEAAAALRAPLYLHPQAPQDPVCDALYSGFGDAIDYGFARFGIGWHYETGVQFMRLALGGVFDRFPELRIGLGHWGEVVVFYLDRADDFAARAGLPLSFTEYARRHAFITAGGLYSHRYLRWAADVVGIERLMFATDYPYRPGPEGGVAGWLAASGLDATDQQRVASGNWEALVAEIRR